MALRTVRYLDLLNIWNTLNIEMFPIRIIFQIYLDMPNVISKIRVIISKLLNILYFNVSLYLTYFAYFSSNMIQMASSGPRNKCILKKNSRFVTECIIQLRIA